MKIIELTQSKYAIVNDADFSWLNQWSWCFGNKGYAIRGERKNKKCKTILMHRFIINCPDNKETDHINHNRLDNRRSNLRICTKQENQTNRKKQLGTSKYKGVSWHKPAKKWVAQIQHNKKHIIIGRFIREQDAANAYKIAAQKYHKEFAYSNVV